METVMNEPVNEFTAKRRAVAQHIARETRWHPENVPAARQRWVALRIMETVDSATADGTRLTPADYREIRRMLDLCVDYAGEG